MTLSHTTLATSAADASAVEAVTQHHAQLAGALAAHVARLVDAAAQGDLDAADRARGALVRWSREELVPHAVAEEQAMYPPAHTMPEGRLLVTSMIDDHHVLTGLIDTVEQSSEPVRAAASATALQVLFDSHLTKENDLVLPLLAGSRDVSVAELLDGMHELLGEIAHDDHDTEAAGGHGCGCGEADPDRHPELDARDIPHVIRHATIFGALDAIAPGEGMVLVAPHDPLPLLAQIEKQSPGRFDVSYLERGPDAWRLQFLRGAQAGEP